MRRKDMMEDRIDKMIMTHDKICIHDRRDKRRKDEKSRYLSHLLLEIKSVVCAYGLQTDPTKLRFLKMSTMVYATALMGWGGGRG